MILVCVSFAGPLEGGEKWKAASGGMVRLEFQRQKGVLEMRAFTGRAPLISRLNDEEKKLTRRMNQLNTKLENYGKHSDEEFQGELNELGALFFGPVQDAILKADVVAIGMSPTMIRFPFEHLHIQGKPLGLQKPVVVYFDHLPASSFSYESLRSALALADLTADPEEACRKAAKRFRNPEYHSLDDIDSEELESLKRHDLLLVSAHGDISFGEDDCIEYDEESYAPKTWAQVRPMLAYFDSCQVGTSREFIEAFRKAGTQYFVAPVTSNEAGNSSTRTINFFFAGLEAGQSPEHALFQAKLQLADHYSAARQSPYGKFLYRVMPFRVYRLN
jgi:hypothetical protein